MARSISTGNYLSSAGLSSEPAQDMSVFLRIKPTWSSGDSASHQFFEYRIDATHQIYFVKHSDNTIYYGIQTGAITGVSGAISDAGLFTAGVWANWYFWALGSVGQIALFKNNTLVDFLDGTAYSQMTGSTALLVGTNASVRPADCDIAEIAEWSRFLDSSERTLLQSTGNPSCISSGLVRHWKVLGNASPEPDEIGADDLSLVGTPAQATHPTVLNCDGSQGVTLPLLAAGGAFYNPTITDSGFTVTLPLLAAGGAFYSPTVTPGAVNITMPLLAAAGSFYNPTVAVVVPPGIGLTLSDSSVLTMTISDSLAQG